MIVPWPVTIHAADATPLSASLFRPEIVDGRAVLVAGALGVTQRYYAPFAAWLAARGHMVMTFDLRGMGASRQAKHSRSLRGLDADMITWARQDFSAAVAHLSEMHAGRSITVLGHSLGLHHAAMTDMRTQVCIAHAIGAGAGAGYWRDWAPRARRQAPLLLYVAGPLMSALFGYFPGRNLRMVGDLPAPAMRQWSRWCRHPEFAWGADPDLVGPSLREARFPVTAFSFTDDEVMTEDCTQKLLAALRNAPSQLQRVDPAEVGRGRIGHLGAFKPAESPLLWERLAQAVECVT